MSDSAADGPPGPPVSPPYPVTFSVDHPDKLDRLTTFFRLIVIIPIAVVLGLVSGSFGTGNTGDGSDPNVPLVLFAGGLLFLPPLLLLLFRRKYPRWWFDWNLELLRFQNRVTMYLFALRDEYPSTDEEQAVHLHIRYPDASTELNRWLPLVKWLLAIPHYIVLFFLGIAALVVVVIGWFAVLFTGRYPRDLFDFVVGVQRWGNRVWGYAFLLVTDRYPPFRLSP